MGPTTWLEGPTHLPTSCIGISYQDNVIKLLYYTKLQVKEDMDVYVWLMLYTISGCCAGGLDLHIGG